jgi:hypothetical protein
VKIATQHPESQGFGAGQKMKEGLLLGGVALEGGDVPPRNIEFPVAVEADLADSSPTLSYQTSMAARVASNRLVQKLLIETSLDRHTVEDISKGSHVPHLGKLYHPNCPNIGRRVQ